MGDSLMDILAIDEAAADAAAKYTSKLAAAQVNVVGRPIAGRNAYFERFVTDLGRSTRIKHVASVDCTNIVLTYGNWGDQDTEPNSAIKVTSSIEFPAGTFRRVHFQGEDATRSIVVAPGTYVRSQPLARPLKAGDVFYTNTTVTPVTAGGQYPAGGIVIAANNAHDKCVVNSATDYTTTANPGTASAQFGFGPVAISGTPRAVKLVIGHMGDSISCGTGDSLSSDGRYEYGFMQRAANAAGLAYVLVGRNGESGSNWNPEDAAADRHRFRSMLLASVDVINGNHSTNDFGNNNRTFAQVVSYFPAVWIALARLGPKVFWNTCTPRTTSTDAWASTTAQAPVNARFGPEAAGAASDRQQWNAWLRDGAPLNPATLAAVAVGTSTALRAGQSGHPLAGIFDTASAVETFDAASQNWVWKAGFTADGIHPNGTGHAAMAVLVDVPRMVAAAGL